MCWHTRQSCSETPRRAPRTQTAPTSPRPVVTMVSARLPRQLCRLLTERGSIVFKKVAGLIFFSEQRNHNLCKSIRRMVMQKRCHHQISKCPACSLSLPTPRTLLLLHSWPSGNKETFCPVQKREQLFPLPYLALI